MLLFSELSAIVDRLMDAEDSSGAYAELGELLREYLGAERVSFTVFDGSEPRENVACGYNEDRKYSSCHARLASAVYSSGHSITSHKDHPYDAILEDTYIAYPVKDREKRIIGVLIAAGSDEDFSERAKDATLLFASIFALLYERNALYLEKHINENLQVIGMMKSSVAHDISNLLGIVRVYLDLVESEVARDSIASEYLDAVRGEISRIATLTSDMLDFSKRNLNLIKNKFSLNKFIEDLERHNRILVRDTDIKLNYRFTNDIEINADKNRLFRVFFNLVKNSVDALKGHGKIEFKAQPIGDSIYFMVMDNGKGISKENMKALFNPFFTSGKPNGTGLGLAVVKDIVLAHGGAVKVRSKEGKYTCFMIRIPING